MNREELSKVAEEIARFVLDEGRVEGQGDEWLASLGLEVLVEADERGLENATEIAEEAVRLHTKAK
jgi:hypothetical protein